MTAQSEEYVSLKDLASELGLDRSNMRKYVMKAGIQPHKRRTPDSGSQLTLVVTPDEADFVRQKRQDEGYGTDTAVTVSDCGVFYVIQLVPELDPQRLKLGFAENLANRLSQHRTVAPTATLLKSWPCKRSWETTVMDALTVNHCRLILNEVFECDSYEELLSFADTLFSLLPDPEAKPRVSQHSPHVTPAHRDMARSPRLANG